MIKRFLLILGLICYLLIPGVSQIRHVKGIKAVEAGYGFNKYGSTYHVGFVNYFSTKFYMKASIFYEPIDYRGLKAISPGIDLAGLYGRKLGHAFYFNVKGGLTVSYDKLTEKISVFDEKGNEEVTDFGTVKMGVLGGLELEYYLSDRWQIILGGHEKFLFKKDTWGQSRWVGYAGIRFKL